MTLQQFSTATYYVKSTMVEMHGTLLLRHEVGKRLNELYDIDGFYVEFSFFGKSSKLGTISCFSILEIDEYLRLVDISEVTDLLT